MTYFWPNRISPIQQQAILNSYEIPDDLPNAFLHSCAHTGWDQIWECRTDPLIYSRDGLA